MNRRAFLLGTIACVVGAPAVVKAATLGDGVALQCMAHPVNPLLGWADLNERSFEAFLRSMAEHVAETPLNDAYTLTITDEIFEQDDIEIRPFFDGGDLSGAALERVEIDLARGSGSTAWFNDINVTPAHPGRRFQETARRRAITRALGPQG